MKHPILKLDPVSDELYDASGLDIPDFSKRRIWIYDLEATGLDTTKERVTQVAGIPLEDGKLIDDEAFCQYVYPGDGIEISKEVQDLTGITLDMLKDAPKFPDVWADCLKAGEGSYVWMGQSVFEFDVPLLETELARHGQPTDLPPTLDSVVLATALLGPPDTRWSTSALLNKFEVTTEGLRRHDALDDVKILGRILIPMIKLIKEEHGDRVHIPANKPVPVKRHPPIRSA